MFQFLHPPSGGARLAIGYITSGVLIVVWSIVWLAYVMNNAESPGSYYYIIAGLIATGLSLLTIGVLVGKIGRQGQQADAAVPAIATTGEAVGNQLPAVGAQAPVAQAAVAPAAQPNAAPAAPVVAR